MTEEMEDEFYLQRLEAGLFSLQLIDYIMLEISTSPPPTVSGLALYPKRLVLDTFIIIFSKHTSATESYIMHVFMMVEHKLPEKYHVCANHPLYG